MLSNRRMKKGCSKLVLSLRLPLSIQVVLHQSRADLWPVLGVRSPMGLGAFDHSKDVSFQTRRIGDRCREERPDLPFLHFECCYYAVGHSILIWVTVSRLANRCDGT